MRGVCVAEEMVVDVRRGANGDGCYIERGRWWSDVERDERMREGEGGFALRMLGVTGG